LHFEHGIFVAISFIPKGRAAIGQEKSLDKIVEPMIKNAPLFSGLKFCMKICCVEVAFFKKCPFCEKGGNNNSFMKYKEEKNEEVLVSLAVTGADGCFQYAGDGGGRQGGRFLLRGRYVFGQNRI